MHYFCTSVYIWKRTRHECRTFQRQRSDGNSIFDSPEMCYQQKTPHAFVAEEKRTIHDNQKKKRERKMKDITNGHWTP